MAKSLRALVKSGVVKAPTHKEFKASEWEGTFGENSDEISDSEILRDAAIAISKELASIRFELEILYCDSMPKIGNDLLKKYFFAVSNRDRFIGRNKIRELEFSGRNIFGAKIKTPIDGNDITFMEHADGSVDGVQKAIAACCYRIDKSLSPKSGTNPVNVVEFVQNEIMLSQMYEIYESYWSALLWGDYDFIWLNKNENTAEIRQSKSQYEIAHEVSQIRIQRRQVGSLPGVAATASMLGNEKFISIKGGGKNREFKVLPVAAAEQHLQFKFAELSLKVAGLTEIFPEDFFQKTIKNSKIDGWVLLRAIVILSLLADQFMDKFPDDDSVIREKDFLHFCPVLKRNRLINALATACGIDFASAVELLELLTYNGPSDDLWCQPFAKDGISDVILLTSSITAPNLTRIIEHWFVKIKVDMTNKGYFFEGLLLDDLEKSMSKNKIISDYEAPRSARFKLSKGEEEIDLLFRIGNKILVGEAKSIVVVDSPISYYRAVNTLMHAAEQAKRKCEFVKENLSEIMTKLGWNYDSLRTYEFQPIIIGSNSIHAGFSISGVPVCDKAILTAYFEKSVFPLLSTMDMKKVRHLAWFEVYKDASSLEQNFFKYILSPPQVTENEENFDYISQNIPVLNGQSLKLVYSRLVIKDVDNKRLLEKKYPFELQMDPEIYKFLDLVDVFI